MAEPKVIGKISNTLEEIRDILTCAKTSNFSNSISAITNANASIAAIVAELKEDMEETNRIVLGENKSSSKNNKKLFNAVNNNLNSIKEILGNISDNIKVISKKINFNLKDNDSRNLLNKIMKEDLKSSGDNKLLRIIDVVYKLKDISIKDLLFAKTKINRISEIYKGLIKTFREFKNTKEIEGVNKFAVSAVKVIKELSKIALLDKSATMGVKVIDKVFFGKFGLVTVVLKMNKHSNEIKKTKSIVDKLYVIAGKMFLITLLMTGVALLGIPAMVGAVMTAGVILVFGGVFSIIGLAEKPIKKGATVMNTIMLSIILAGVGLLLLNKGTKDLKWEQLAKVGVAILGFGAIAALLGVPTVFALVSLGCLSLTLMGVALMSIGAGVAVFGALVTNESVRKVEKGIPKIFNAMTSIFGDGKDSKGNISFGNSIFGLITGCLKLGGALFASAALMIISLSLGFAGLTLRSWANFPMQAIDNIETAVNRLDNIFGFGLKKDRHSDSKFGFVGQLGGLFTDTVGLVSTLLQSGRTFAVMGTLLFAGIVLGIIKNSLDKWKSFDTSSLNNIETAINRLDDIFSLGLKENRHSAGVFSFITQPIGVVSDVIGLASTLLQAGKTFVTMGTLLMAVSVADIIRKKIESWKNFDASPMDNVLDAVDRFGKFFGIGVKENNGIFGSIGNAIGGIFGTITGPFELAATLFKSGKIMMKLATYSLAVGVVNKLVKTMIKAGKNANVMDKSLDAVFDVFDRLEDYFFDNNVSKSSLWKIGAGILGTVVGGPILGLGLALMTGSKGKDKLSIMTTAVGIVDKIVNVIIKMGKYSGNVNNALDTTFYALNKLTDYFFGDANNTESSILERIGKSMKKSSRSGGLWEFMFGDGSSVIETRLEVLTSTIGVVSAVSDVIVKMKDIGPDIDTAIQNVFYALDRITESFFGPADSNQKGALEKVGQAMANAHKNGGFWDTLFGDGSSEINTQLEIIMGCVGVVSQVADIIDTMSNNKDNITNNIDNLFAAMNTMVTRLLSMNRGQLDDAEDIASELPDIFGYISDVLTDMGGNIEKGITNIENLSRALLTFNNCDLTTMKNVGIYTGNMIDKIMEYSKSSNINTFNKTLMSLCELGGKGNTAFNSINKMITKINTIDLEKATALRDTFKSFTNINSFGGFFSNFKNNVKMFTDACIRLVDAINGNTDAISSSYDNDTTSSTEQDRRSIAISNVKELAEKIAESLSVNTGGYGIMSTGGEVEVNLRINGDGGNNWIISRY